uniref:Uncharacterized protein n=1 Tax=Manihot esculenta TaxID=3983 RepID=A0A2C9V9N1_MANES
MFIYIDVALMKLYFTSKDGNMKREIIVIISWNLSCCNLLPKFNIADVTCSCVFIHVDIALMKLFYL